ncbi:MAG: FimB/Mfa2 family fimbrial subunit, partial [Tannerellaceae bacterium]|nr:FimB/Mfa2 family fimbrial subunit [Tannerellaceae bacterium]
MKKILLLTVSLLFTLISCSDDANDLIETPNPGPGVSATDQSVEIAFKSAISDNGSVSFSDEDVEELDILVFKGDEYQYRRNAYTSNYATFRSTLKIDNDLDLYFFANSRSALTDELLTEGDSWEEIREKLVISFTDTIIHGKQVVPMWGQVKNTRVSDDLINRYEVSLLRSVASANIIFKLKDTGTLAFEPKVAFVYYTSDCGFLAPAPHNLDLDGNDLRGVFAAESPSYMRTNIRKRMDFDVEKGAFPAPFMMFDNETSETKKKHPENRRTRVVVGGHLNGSSALTYYPLDFF